MFTFEVCLYSRELFDNSDRFDIVAGNLWKKKKKTRAELKSLSQPWIRMNSANGDYAKREHRSRRCLGDDNGASTLRWEVHRDAMLIEDRAESDSRGGGGEGGSTPRSTQWKMLGHFGSNESILGYLAVKGTHICMYPGTRRKNILVEITI